MKLSDINAYRYTEIIMSVLRGLKSECERHEGCGTDCALYNKAYGCCYLKNPCDYELDVIEKGVHKIITNELKKDDTHRVKCGRWSECYTDTHHYSGICSVCGKASIKSLTEDLYSYCPKCGAKMIKGGDNND